MRRADRNLWQCFVLVVCAACVAGCSAIVDFPAPSVQPEEDTGPVRRDAGRDTGQNPADTSPPGCDPRVLTSCGDQQLCCDRSDGKPAVCVDVSGAGDCTECGVGCSDPAAPNCGNRVCQCEAGTGKGCAAGQICVGSGAGAKCVQCSTDLDCAANTDKRNQCVDSKCVECDRGPLLADPADDEGCGGNTPICSSTNQCVGCSATLMCRAGQKCNEGRGCFGCKVLGPLAENGCGSANSTTPICVQVMLPDNPEPQFQCKKCENNTECGLAYCDNNTGACVNACDPNEAPGANGCMDKAAPICKPSAGSYACAPCAAASDCKAPAINCAIEGPLTGQCVVCRSNADCDQRGPTPVCSATGTCRPRVAGDCAGTAKPRFDPVSLTCLECLAASQATDCAGKPAGAFCNPLGVCSQCLGDDNCPSSTPVCDTTTNRCVGGCSGDSQCPVTTPFCINKMCAPCTGLSAAMAAGRCSSITALEEPICVSAGPLLGRCGVCNPAATQAGCPGQYCNPNTATCIACDTATDLGCEDTPATPQCVAIGATPAACHACDPVNNAGCTAPQTCSATTLTCVSAAPSDAGAPDAGT